MKKLLVLLKKEIRELITPLLIVPLVMMVALFSGIGSLTKKQSEQAKQPQPITVLDNDGSPVSQLAVASLQHANLLVNFVDNQPVDIVLSRAENDKSIGLIVIPQGFGEGIQNLQPQTIQVYSLLHSLSQKTGTNDAALKLAVAALNETISSSLIQSMSTLNPAVVKQPVQLDNYVVVNQKQAHVGLSDVIGYVQQQTYFIPIILFIVIIFAAQMIATSIASEKENKTLETLLTAPVSRQTIVTAKLLAAGLVALFFAAVYVFGFRSYLNGISGGQIGGAMSPAVATALVTLGLKFGPLQYLYLGLSLFFGILSALAIALILGAFAEDVKSIQSVITPLMVLVMIPYFLVTFLDFSSLSPVVRGLIYLIPFSHPFLATQNIVFGNYTALIGGIVYQAVIFLVFVTIASKIFASDAIVTMKLNWGKKR